MKHKNTMYLILLTIFILSLPICAYADNSVIISKDDFSTDTKFQNAIDNAFENDENFTIVLDDDTISRCSACLLLHYQQMLFYTMLKMYRINLTLSEKTT